MRIDYGIFDTLLEPVFVLNAEQKIIYCNEAAANLCGSSPRKLSRGPCLSDQIIFSEPVEALSRLREICEPTPYKEVSFTTPQGQSGTVQLTLQPIFDQMGDKAWMLFIRDVTLEERLQKKYRSQLEQKEKVIQDLENAKIQLEDYSKNLEQKVTDRTHALSSLNQRMSALLDSLHEGFLIFDSVGQVLDVSSKACTKILEGNPQGQMIWDVLKLSESETESFKKWMLTLFGEMLPFSDLAPLGPTHYQHSEGRVVSLDYHPLRSGSGSIEGIVTVASDITSLVEAQAEARRERSSAKFVLNLIQYKKQIVRFAQEAQNLLNEILPFPEKHCAQETILRALHTIKGGANQFSIQDLAEACHLAETSFATKTSTHEKSEALAQVNQSLRDFLQSARSILGKNAFSAEPRYEISLSELQTLTRKIQRLPGGGNMAHLLLSEVVLEPIGDFFSDYQRLCQRLAEQQGKESAPVELINSDISVLPSAYSSLFAACVHAFRNAVDHGIETATERQHLGKRTQAQIRVCFSVTTETSRPQLSIVIEDDGRGIDPQAIRAKLSSEAANKPDHEIIQSVFATGFSGRHEVTELSGRGIGLAALKTAAEELGGMVEVQSQLNQGCRLQITVPYINTLPIEEPAQESAA